ncbi:MAG: hypothetical protein ACYDBQ_00860 [Thermoplasmatota archaeon]
METLRLALHGLEEGHRILYHVVSWFGTFVHEVSHALVLVLSGHGIREFRAGSEQGHVLPARIARGPVGFLFFLVAALAPLFIPPLMVVAALWALHPPPPLLVDGGATWAGAVAVMRHLAVDLPAWLASAAVGLRLANPWGLAAFLLILLAIPGARPSHVKGSRFHPGDEGDVAVLRRMVRHNPWPLLAFLALVVGLYVACVVAVPALSEWYWIPFEAVAGLAVVGSLLALFGTLWWGAMGLSGRAGRWWAWLVPAGFAAAQVLLASRGPEVANLASLAAWLAVGLALRLVLPRGVMRYG